MRLVTWWKPWAMRMVALILLSDASSLALEYPSWIVRRMSGRRRRIFFGEFDDLGYARVGRPEHPVVQFAAGLFDRMLEQGPQ